MVMVRRQGAGAYYEQLDERCEGHVLEDKALALTYDIAQVINRRRTLFSVEHFSVEEGKKGRPVPC